MGRLRHGGALSGKTVRAPERCFLAAEQWPCRAPVPDPPSSNWARLMGGLQAYAHAPATRGWRSATLRSQGSRSRRMPSQR